MAETAWQFVFCLLAADFITGVGHWFEDTYGLPTWPVLGKLLIVDNIHHHRSPREMAPTFWSRNYQQFALATGVLVVLHFAGWLYWQAAVVVVLASFGNETHSWCHGAAHSPLVRFLQDMGITISPVQHARHHRRPYDRTFCTLTNWVNPILDRLHFWPVLEGIIAILGCPPKRLSAERDGL